MDIRHFPPTLLTTQVNEKQAETQMKTEKKLLTIPLNVNSNDTVFKQHSIAKKMQATPKLIDLRPILKEKFDQNKLLSRDDIGAKTIKQPQLIRMPKKEMNTILLESPKVSEPKEKKPSVRRQPKLIDLRATYRDSDVKPPTLIFRPDEQSISEPTMRRRITNDRSVFNDRTLLNQFDVGLENTPSKLSSPRQRRIARQVQAANNKIGKENVPSNPEPAHTKLTSVVINKEEEGRKFPQKR